MDLPIQKIKWRGFFSVINNVLHKFNFIYLLTSKFWLSRDAMKILNYTIINWLAYLDNVKTEIFKKPWIVISLHKL